MYYCLLLLIVLGLSACSDDSSSSSKKDENPESSSSADSLEGAALPFVGGPVMFTEVDPINIVFNTSADTVDLTGMFLTDSKSEPFKWKFGNVKVAPNSFLLVFMSGKNYPDYVLPHDTLDMVGSGCWTWTELCGPVAG